MAICKVKTQLKYFFVSLVFIVIILLSTNLEWFALKNKVYSIFFIVGCFTLL